MDTSVMMLNQQNFWSVFHLISLAVFPFAAAPLYSKVTRSLVQGASDYAARIEHLRHGALKSPVRKRPSIEAVIGHTFALFDSALEKSHEKSKH